MRSPLPAAAHERASASTARSMAGEMGRGAFWLSVLTLIASAINYGSNLVFSRLLPPASFGDLTALLALSVVVSVPTAAAQTRIAERIAAYTSSGDDWHARYLVRHALAHLATLAAAATALYVLLIPLVVKALDLQAPGPAIALAPLIALSFLFPLPLGTLQGNGRFVAFGAVAVAIAAARLVFGVPWVEAGGGAGGAIAGQALGMLICLLGVLWLLRGQMLGRGSGAASSGLRRRPDVRAVTAGAAFVAFAIIQNFDIVLAKLWLPAHEAGLYAALATVGKVVTFLPAAVAVMLVPNAARAKSPGERARVLRLTALLVLATTVIAAVPAALAPTFVIRTMFGSHYLAATSGVLPIVCAGAALSLLYLLVVFAVTIEDRRWTVLLVVGVVLQSVGIALLHGSPTQVAGVQAGTVLVVLLLNEVMFHSLILTPRHAR